MALVKPVGPVDFVSKMQEMRPEYTRAGMLSLYQWLDNGRDFDTEKPVDTYFDPEVIAECWREDTPDNLAKKFLTDKELAEYGYLETKGEKYEYLVEAMGIPEGDAIFSKNRKTIVYWDLNSTREEYDRR